MSVDSRPTPSGRKIPAPPADVGVESSADRLEPNPYHAQARLELPSAADSRVEELTTAECWRLVEASHLGRLAVDAFDGRPDVFPLNFLVHNGNVFLRSAPGAKLRSIAQNPAVAFEVDGSDDGFHWSVVIRADAARMDTDAEIEASGVLDLVSWSPTSKHDFIRLVPVAITGRRFSRYGHRPLLRREPQPAIPERGGAMDSAPAEVGSEPGKPQPIPHFAPLPHLPRS